MAVEFAGSTIVSDSVSSAYYGSASAMIGNIEEEVYEFSIPRSNGIGERFSGVRKREIDLTVTYFSGSPSTVMSTLDNARREMRYGALNIDGRVYSNCRLIGASFTGFRRGRNSRGDVTVFEASLRFRQVR